MIEPEDMRRFQRHIEFFTRAAADDPAAFAQVVSLYEELGMKLRAATPGLLRQGFSWEDIASALGVRKPSAWERWRSRSS